MQQMKTRRTNQPNATLATQTFEAKVVPKEAAPTTLPAAPTTVDVKASFCVGPLESTGEIIDITHDVVEVIAREVWKRGGGNDLLNWIEAERLFAEAMQAARTTPVLKHPILDRHGRYADQSIG